MSCGSSFLVCPCPMCSFTTYSLLIHSHPSMFLRFTVSDLRNISLASNIHANLSGWWVYDPWKQSQKNSLKSQAVFSLKDCTMSVCAQAYLLSGLSSASKIYRVSLDQDVMLCLAVVGARNWHFVHFIFKKGIYFKSWSDTASSLENKCVGKSSFNLSLDGAKDSKF